MKVSFILLAAIFYSLHVKGQQNNIFKNKPWKDFRKKELLTQELKRMNPEINKDNFSERPAAEPGSKSVLKIPLTGTYIGNNGKGADIYAMSPYKMPCIAPDKTFTSNMPIAGNEKSVKGYVAPFKKLKKETE